jgi:hypothetical protein
MIEGGTKSHEIAPKAKKALAWENVRASVTHPGIKAQRPMERAFQDQGPAAVNAFGNYIRGKLTKSGLFNPATETE